LFVCYIIELLEGDAGLEERAGVWEGLELFVRGHHVLWAVAFDLFASVIGGDGGKMAWPMEVDAGVEMIAVEGVDEVGVLLRDVDVAEDFAHNGVVLAFGQCVVVGVSGS